MIPTPKAAAQALHEILVDYARRFRNHPGDVLEVHGALGDLYQLNPRLAELVKLRYFGGLSNPEAAEVLGTPLPVVEREWMVARLWLRRRLLVLGRGPSQGLGLFSP